ncbi:MAG TPA: DUF6800 family protein [Terriglobales bacterium]|nr:DUF6800 family protein [Terriglobales bacterium]
MTTPSRRPEIRRRRARKEKIARLRRQYVAAASEAERKRIVEKAKKSALGLSAEAFLAPLEAKKG